MLQRVLTDNGKEYGSSEPTYDHYYGASCLILSVKHITTKVKHPWTNGYAERFIKTLYQEFFQVALRRKRYSWKGSPPFQNFLKVLRVPGTKLVNLLIIIEEKPFADPGIGVLGGSRPKGLLPKVLGRIWKA